MMRNMPYNTRKKADISNLQKNICHLIKVDADTGTLF